MAKKTFQPDPELPEEFFEDGLYPLPEKRKRGLPRPTITILTAASLALFKLIFTPFKWLWFLISKISLGFILAISFTLFIFSITNYAIYRFNSDVLASKSMEQDGSHIINKTFSSGDSVDIPDGIHLNTASEFYFRIYRNDGIFPEDQVHSGENVPNIPNWPKNKKLYTLTTSEGQLPSYHGLWKFEILDPEHGNGKVDAKFIGSEPFQLDDAGSITNGILYIFANAIALMVWAFSMSLGIETAKKNKKQRSRK